MGKRKAKPMDSLHAGLLMHRKPEDEKIVAAIDRYRLAERFKPSRVTVLRVALLEFLEREGVKVDD